VDLNVFFLDGFVLSADDCMVYVEGQFRDAVAPLRPPSLRVVILGHSLLELMHQVV
jgi:hypothetical protein